MKNIFAFALSVNSLLLVAQPAWPWNNNFPPGNGPVSIGCNTNPTGKIEIYDEPVFLGGINDYRLISKVSGNYGTAANGARYSENLWITRINGGGQTFDKTGLLNGLSIDFTFDEPGSSNDRPRTWWLRDGWGDKQSWGNAANTYMTLDQGRLAINKTSAPAARLDIEETGGNTGLIVRSNNSTQAPGLNIYSSSSVDQTKAFVAAHKYFNGTTQNDMETFVVKANGGVTMTTNELNAFVLKDENWTINFKVKKTGFVYCRELQVMTGVFPDYVFDKTYKRLTLKELESYIENNKRLPGFKPAEFYVENGIQTSEMFVKQQEKIEELTLYLIELNNSLELLKKQNQELRDLISH